jgi:maltoporin
MKAMMKAVTVVAALLAFATPAMALDMLGYFRDGFSLSGKGGPAPTFQTPYMDYKLRLGNENDTYGEWGLEQTIYKDKAGVEVKVGVMFAYYLGADGQAGDSKGYPFGIQQDYFKMKFPQLAGATLWGGKVYYQRENIDMIDHFYLNTGSVPGIGVTDVDVGMGKLSFSVFGVNGPDASNNKVIFLRPDLRWSGIPVWANGTLMFDLNYETISRHSGKYADGTEIKAPKDEGGGVWVTGEWHQDGILGGWNQLTLQFANGANANMNNGAPGVSTDGTGFSQNKNDNQFAAWEQLLLQPMAMFQVLVGGSYQMKTFGIVGGGSNKLNSFGIFARPKVWLADYFAIQGDIGYTSVTAKPKGHFADGSSSKTANLLKWTIAPTVLPAQGEGGGFFVRPEFRLYVTGGSWSVPKINGTPIATVAGGNFGTDSSGITYGAQVEGWW